MKKRFKNLILIVLIISVLMLIFAFSRPTGYVIEEQKKQVQFHFYDESNNCPLNGYVFIGNKLIGKSEQGYFNLTYENYIDNFIIPENISIFGRLGDCFEKDSELYFDKYWEAFEIEKYYFSGESLFNFKAIINKNNPSKRELIGFIQSESVGNELNKINLNNENALEDLSKINNYLNNEIRYLEDWDFNKETNYWQTPAETLNLKTGDCEDYSTALLSLFLAYNNSLNCYNIVFESHVTTLCFEGDYYIYYDQKRTEIKKQVNKANYETAVKNLKEFNNKYLEDYGLNKSITPYYAFNDNEYIEFKNENDFTDWQYNLESTKKQFNLFEDLEKQAIEPSKSYPQEKAETGELATQSPSSQVQSTKPFPYLILFLLIASFIILVILLIIVNKN